MGITINEAIEILEKEEEDTWMGPEDKWKSAVKMGYEALKRIRHDRLVSQPKHILLLPEEAEDIKRGMTETMFINPEMD